MTTAGVVDSAGRGPENVRQFTTREGREGRLSARGNPDGRSQTTEIIMNRLKAFALALSLLVAAIPAEAASTIYRLDAPEVLKIVTDMGYDSAFIDDDGDLIIHMHDYKVLLMLRPDNSNMMMLFSVAGTDASMRDTNAWNAERRFSMAYIDNEGDPVLQSDFDLSGGVSYEAVREFVRTYDMSLGEFITVIS